MTELNQLERELYSRAVRACIHRLRGLCGLLGGWAVMELPDGMEQKIDGYVEESNQLYSLLDQLRLALELGVRPKDDQFFYASLLSSVLGLGTMSETDESFPVLASCEEYFEFALEIQAKLNSNKQTSSSNKLLVECNGEELIVKVGEQTLTRPCSLPIAAN